MFWLKCSVPFCSLFYSCTVIEGTHLFVYRKSFLMCPSLFFLRTSFVSSVYRVFSTRTVFLALVYISQKGIIEYWFNFISLFVCCQHENLCNLTKGSEKIHLWSNVCSKLNIRTRALAFLSDISELNKSYLDSTAAVHHLLSFIQVTGAGYRKTEYRVTVASTEDLQTICPVFRPLWCQSKMIGLIYQINVLLIQF